MDAEQVDLERAAKIAALNDKFRSSGNVHVTKSLLDNISGFYEFVSIGITVRKFDSFNIDNDAYGEHDLGTFDWNGKKIMWKIDYYDQALTGWCDPLDPKCRRVLTIMLASDYYARQCLGAVTAASKLYFTPYNASLANRAYRLRA